jgi:hypothetical protein
VIKLVHFKGAVFLITVMLGVGSLVFAQEAKPRVKSRVPVGTEPDSTQREHTEQERLNLAKAKLLREHMDASGHIRPDLRSAGIAQIKRMKTATHIGPIPKEPQAQSK